MVESAVRRAVVSWPPTRPFYANRCVSAPLAFSGRSWLSVRSWRGCVVEAGGESAVWLGRVGWVRDVGEIVVDTRWTRCGQRHEQGFGEGLIGIGIGVDVHGPSQQLCAGHGKGSSLKAGNLGCHVADGPGELVVVECG